MNRSAWIVATRSAFLIAAGAVAIWLAWGAA